MHGHGHSTMGPMTTVEEDASQKYRSNMLNNLVDSGSVCVGDSTLPYVVLVAKE